MIRQVAIAAALAVSTGAALATTTVGGATLIDTATVHAGTVSPTAYLSYVSGSNGLTGWADGSTWGPNGMSVFDSLATADHHWAQYDPAIFMTSGTTFLSRVLAIPAIDHGWAADNTAEFYEPFEFRILGCTAPTLSACSEEGTITDVYTRGVDDTGGLKNADDFSSVWAFRSAYNFFAVVSGDRLVGGPWSPGEGEIDALAMVGEVPEPSTYAMLVGGLGLMAFVARRRSRK